MCCRGGGEGRGGCVCGCFKSRRDYIASLNVVIARVMVYPDLLKDRH